MTAIRDFLYCIAFLRKIKEIFCPSDHFFTNFPGPPQGKGRQAEPLGGGIGPKGPHRAQKRGQGAEKQHRAPRNAKEQKPPQVAGRPLKGEQKDAGGTGEAVDPVKKGRQRRQPLAQRAQQVVHQAQGEAQQYGLTKQRQLP